MQLRKRELAAGLTGPLDVRSIALSGLFILAIFYTLYVARSFLLPVVLALLLSFLLNPAVRWLRRIAIPEALGAAIVLVLVLGVVVFGVYRLAEPATAWMLTAPESLRRVEYKLQALRKPMQDMAKAADQVASLATVEQRAPAQNVHVSPPTFSDALFTYAHGFLASALIMFILLYFFLSSRNLFLRKLVKVLPTLEDKKRALDIARQIEDQIATYLVSVTLINSALGILVGTAMYGLGIPNALLWGVMAALFNFVPFVGPLTGIVVLALVGVMTFDHLGWALVPPAIYLGLHGIEANFVTPALLGRRLALNPVTIFVAVTFWGWMWGIAGALLAVPMLATFKIFCDEIEPLAPVAEFLGP